MRTGLCCQRACAFELADRCACSEMCIHLHINRPKAYQKRWPTFYKNVWRFLVAETWGLTASITDSAARINVVSLDTVERGDRWIWVGEGDVAVGADEVEGVFVRGRRWRLRGSRGRCGAGGCARCRIG